MTWKSNGKRSAFTLIEITAVILILSITAAAVVLGTVGPGRISKMRDLVGLIRSFDSLTRTYASNTGRDVFIVVDTDLGEIRRMDRRREQTLGRPLILPGDWRVAEVRIFGSGPIEPSA